MPDREEIAIPIIEHVIAALSEFAASGFSGFHERWHEFDWLAGKAVRVTTAGGDLDGAAAGIDNDGAFLLQRDDTVERIVSGSVTLL